MYGSRVEHRDFVEPLPCRTTASSPTLSARPDAQPNPVRAGGFLPVPNCLLLCACGRTARGGVQPSCQAINRCFDFSNTLLQFVTFAGDIQCREHGGGER